jgi:hypothetical protein
MPTRRDALLDEVTLWAVSALHPLAATDAANPKPRTAIGHFGSRSVAGTPQSLLITGASTIMSQAMVCFFVFTVLFLMI